MKLACLLYSLLQKYPWIITINGLAHITIFVKTAELYCNLADSQNIWNIYIPSRYNNSGSFSLDTTVFIYNLTGSKAASRFPSTRWCSCKQLVCVQRKKSQFPLKRQLNTPAFVFLSINNKSWIHKFTWLKSAFTYSKTQNKKALKIVITPLKAIMK